MTKWVIRIYIFCDSKTGYICGIFPYYGNIIEILIRLDPMQNRIPLHLYKKVLDKVSGAQGYHMLKDRYYTSLNLAGKLLKMKCHLTGTEIN